MTQPTTTDNAATVEYRTALVNALRPVSAGLAALHAAKSAVFSPLTCTRCGHDLVSVRSRSILSSEYPKYRRKHVMERTCSTCGFVEVLEAGNPPVFHSRHRKKRSSNPEYDHHDPIQVQHPIVPATPSVRKTTKKLSELQQLLARNRQRQEKQEQKRQQQSNDKPKGGLSAFLDTL